MYSSSGVYKQSVNKKFFEGNWKRVYDQSKNLFGISIEGHFQ